MINNTIAFIDGIKLAIGVLTIGVLAIVIACVLIEIIHTQKDKH